MLLHRDLPTGFTGQRILAVKIQYGAISFAGNKNLKIYGTLNCSSGKKMKKNNRIFFHSASEAISMGYRPCGRCLKKEYIQWKQKI